jgi:two-component system, OmpR family, sensor histidine kinase QseC
LDLLPISRQVFADFYAQAEQKQQQLEILSEGEFWVLGEPGAMTILFGNLVSNAIKYTPCNGQITLRLNRRPTGIDWTLEDSGPGIPEQLHERVYDRFYRVGGDRHHSNALGCGLGLSIAAQITQLLGAVMQLGSSSLQGLSVRVTFPIYEGGKPCAR